MTNTESPRPLPSPDQVEPSSDNAQASNAPQQATGTTQEVLPAEPTERAVTVSPSSSHKPINKKRRKKFNAICERLAKGESLAAVCKDPILL